MTQNPESTHSIAHSQDQTSGGTGQGDVQGQSVNGIGVKGTSTTGTGVEGDSTSGAGVLGRSTSDTGAVGISDSGQGVYGYSKSQTGVRGESDGSDGVFGLSHSAQHAGVIGQNTAGGNGGYFYGDVVVTGTLRANVDVVLGADCAEDFDVITTGNAEPGTVMVLGEHGVLHPSQHAYDTKVVGVISGAGEYKPGLILDRRASTEGRMPVALIGKVYCKVDAEYAAIKVSDLLTTSPTPGHAMKADDAVRAFGAVIGKALRPLQQGQSLIPILISLQ